MKKILNEGRIILISFVCLCNSGVAFSQAILNKTISVEVNRQSIDNVLEIISNKGNFYFSYNSSIIRKDSLVSFSATNKTVRQILDMMFDDGLEYIESGNYLILRRRPITMMLVTDQAATEDKLYTITGLVLDEQSGERIGNASVYEKQRLVSTLTNNNGYFKLKLKSRYSSAQLTVSKQFYRDATVSVKPGFNQQVNITIVPIESEATMVTIAPEDYYLPDTIIVQVKKPTGTEAYVYTRKDSVTVERKGLGRLLLSSKQKIQTLNLGNFFTSRPYQISLTPGLSTHGKLNGQVVNNFSLNILGGYSGGVNGAEVAGVFNIDKKNVKYVQVAGVFNLVGGSVKGLQVAGVLNTVLDSANGVQIGGVANTVNGKFRGLQLSGVYNHATDSIKGWQVAGVTNLATKKIKGTQFAGTINVALAEVDGLQLAGTINVALGAVEGVQASGNLNVATKTVKGVQIAGNINIATKSVTGVQVAGNINVSAGTVTGTQVAPLINYARKLKGVQVGLINIADTSDGYSIGIVNLVLKGYHKLSISYNEIMNVNVALKTGNGKLYSMLMGGLNWNEIQKIYSVGFGVGRENNLSKLFALNTELSSQYLYLGDWKANNYLSKFAVQLNWKISKYISIYAGPTLNVYYTDQAAAVAGYKYDIHPFYTSATNTSNKIKVWAGWNAGIHLF